MRRTRLLILFLIAAAAFGLLCASLTLADTERLAPTPAPGAADEPAPAADPPRSRPVKAANDRSPTASPPLFVAVDNAARPAYTIDVASGAAFPAFTGAGVWGAAHVPAGNRVLFSNGADLYEWAVGDAVTFLGTVSDTTGTEVLMEGLAYANGVLYASKTGLTGEGEGIYQVDLTTLQASRVISYVNPADVLIGGLDADPATGRLYGTNDDSAFYGLVEIGMNGVVTPLAPYLGGETDVDGLAVGGGKAYLITDDGTPPYFNVFDFGVMTYTGIVSSPYTTNEVYAAGAWIYLPPGTSQIALRKTAGTDPHGCAADSQLSIAAGTAVTYCYRVRNSGNVTLTLHDLADSALGSVLSGLAAALPPGASLFVTDTAIITQTTANTATWTAYNAGPADVATATAAALVTVVPPTIQLQKTVGTNPAACATTPQIAVPAGTAVTYCYRVSNVGLTTLTRHDLSDTELGTLLNGLNATLLPGASLFVTQTTTIQQTTVNTATWTAYNPGPADTAVATAAATVTIIPPAPVSCNGPTVGFPFGIPVDWTVVNNAPGNPVVWSNLAGCGEAANYATGSGDVACASSDLQAGGRGLYDTELWTPPVDLTGVEQIALDYWANYGNFAAGDFLDVDISTNGGITWTTILSWNDDHHPNGLRRAPGEHVTLDLAPYAGQANTRLRWRYYDPTGPASSQDWYAQLDDVTLSCLAGTLGISLNKTVGLAPGVCATTDTLTVQAGTAVYYCYQVTNTGTITASLHDLIDDQFGTLLSGYSLDLAPGASVDTVALGMEISATLATTTTNLATWTSYQGAFSETASDAVTVSVIAPEAQINPAAISEELSVDEQRLVQLTLANPGSDTLVWSLDEEAAGRRPPESVGTAWETMAPAPAPRAFPAVVADANGYVYLIGGTSDGAGTLPTDTLFRYDVAANSWTTLTAMPTPLDSVDAAVIQNRIYVPGSDANGGSTYVYDIGAGSWSTLTASGGYTGRTQYQAVANGDDLLVLGGVANGASTAEVWVLDTTTGMWSAGVPMQHSRISFSAAASSGAIYVAGGVAFPGFAPDMTAERFDGGSWSFIASVPNGGGAYTRWSYNADALGADGLWLAAGRRDAGWSVINHAAYYNPATNAWTDSPTVPALAQGRVYLEGDVASDGYFYAIGGRDPAATVAYATNERLQVGLPRGGCAPTDLPWLSASPASGSLIPGQSQTITVTLDAAGLDLDTYTANLCLTTNDPNRTLIRIPVTIDVVARVNLRVAHLAPFAPGSGTAVTITLNGAPVLSSALFGSSSLYRSTGAGPARLQIWPVGSSTPLISDTVTLIPGLSYTAVAIGTGTNRPLDWLILVDNLAAPVTGSVRLRFGHLAPAIGGGSVVDFRLQDGNPLLTSIPYGEVAASLQRSAGTLDLRVTSPGGGADLIDPLPLDLAGGEIASLFSVGDSLNQPLGLFVLPADQPGFLLSLFSGHWRYLPLIRTAR